MKNRKQDSVIANKSKLSQSVLENYSNSFDIDFTHNSTPIEINTLTLMETKLLLEDKIYVGTQKLREIYEVVNHNKVWNYVKNKVSNNEVLDE